MHYKIPYGIVNFLRKRWRHELICNILIYYIRKYVWLLLFLFEPSSKKGHACSMFVQWKLCLVCPYAKHGQIELVKYSLVILKPMHVLEVELLTFSYVINFYIIWIFYWYLNGFIFRDREIRPFDISFSIRHIFIFKNTDK